MSLPSHFLIKARQIIADKYGAEAVGGYCTPHPRPKPSQRLLSLFLCLRFLRAEGAARRSESDGLG
jgi:hypothetical protein